MLYLMTPILFYLFIVAGLFFMLKNITNSRRLRYLKIQLQDKTTGKKNNKIKGIFAIIAGRVGDFFSKITNERFRRKYERSIEFIRSYQDINFDFNILFGYKILSALCGFLIALFALEKLFYLIPGLICLFLTGFFIPDIVIKILISRKLEEFNLDLPYVIDLLYITSLSGQNIYNSIKILIQKYNGAIASELQRFLRELELGLGREQAYENAISRNNPDGFKNLLFLLMQAEKFGSKTSEILKQKSKYLRFETAQKVEAESRRVSVFLIFPLVFFILPAFILLVGGPLIFSIAGSFKVV